MDKALSSSKQKKYDKAIETYTKVINRNNKLQLAYYNRGFDYLATKQYDKALWDFNKVMALQSHGDFIITYNQNSPFADEEARAQIPYNDALYQRAQVKYFMDSLKSSFIDFQTLVDNNYEEKSNCLLWQGTIYVRSGKTEKACTYFDNAKQVALTDDDRNEATEMIKTYCGQTNNNR
ncbi:tetratricopeptide repeat protein [Phnomibacter ginsenosidimutans]|uniref:tetratricopeptide repeat protein n=1 Tax=Phnomibacter ginsenosidimutans TaxID=2676868 RepID=UPI0018D25D42|nr:tetratricopeptide repeat protein [Phnomibacter ginsenosidimutans]